jgi:DNA-binding NarL/FixJ family response regulator
MCHVRRILVVDDFVPFRNLVGSILGVRAGWQVVGEAGDGLEAIEKAAVLQPELIVLDIALPTINGIRVAEEIRKTAPHCKIIFLSQETSADVVEEAIRLRVSGYVNKAKAAHELAAAIDAVLKGNRFFSAGLLSARDLGGLSTEER